MARIRGAGPVKGRHTEEGTQAQCRGMPLGGSAYESHTLSIAHVRVSVTVSVGVRVSFRVRDRGG